MLFKKYGISNRQPKFYLSAWDDRSFDSDVRWNENKTLLNKIINCCSGTNYLVFHEGKEAKEHFGILFIGLFCLRAHPTITMRELLFDCLM